MIVAVVFWPLRQAGAIRVTRLCKVGPILLHLIGQLDQVRVRGLIAKIAEDKVEFGGVVRRMRRIAGVEFVFLSWSKGTVPPSEDSRFTALREIGSELDVHASIRRVIGHLATIAVESINLQ